jgi:hypothetical protein
MAVVAGFPLIGTGGFTGDAKATADARIAFTS